MEYGALYPPSIDQWYLLVKILISFLAGALIGLEREKAKTSVLKEEGESGLPPGVRSFGFISLLGLFSIVIPQIVGQSVGLIEFVRILPIAITILTVSIIVLYSAYRLLMVKEAGITTPLALSLTFAVGILIGLDRLIEAIATSVFVTFMLAIKLRIEALIRFITYEELLSMLEIGIIVFLLGPFLAVDVYDPVLHVINFKVLYIFFVVILVFSLLGYFLVKIKGPKAIEYFSFFGGLVHSEAAVVSVIKLRRHLRIPNSIVSGSIIIASTAMIFRNIMLTLVMLIVTVSHLVLGEIPFMVFAIAFLISALEGYFMVKLAFATPIPVSEEKIKGMEIAKPISYSIALKALLIFAAMLIVVTYTTFAFGKHGVIISSIFGGLVSAEALIFTVFSLLSAKKIAVNTALAAALLATGSAILNKIFFAKAAGAESNILKQIIWQLAILSLPVEIAGIYIAFIAG